MLQSWPFVLHTLCRERDQVGDVGLDERHAVLRVRVPYLGAVRRAGGRQAAVAVGGHLTADLVQVGRQCDELRLALRIDLSGRARQPGCR